VDDLLITAIRDADIDLFLEEFARHVPKFTINRDRVISYLGMQFDFRIDGEVSITMKGYIDDIIRNYNVNSKAKTPATNELFKITDSTRLSVKDSDTFHSQVAKLLYLAKKSSTRYTIGS
jgi:hypothetical protein